MRKGSLIVILGLAFLLITISTASQKESFLSEASDAVQPLKPSSVKAEVDFGRMPLYFVENKGQMDERVAYYVQGKDKTIYFSSGGVTFVLVSPGSSKQETEGKDLLGLKHGADMNSGAGQVHSLNSGLVARDSVRGTSGEGSKAAECWVVKLEFIGANRDVRPLGQDKTGAIISYFKGKPEEWRTGLPTYSRIVYRNLWPGIDLVYCGTVNKLKYEFLVHPGADASKIKLAYRGASDVAMGGGGRLEVKTPLGSLRDDEPVAYQEVGGKRMDIPMGFVLKEAGRGSTEDDSRDQAPESRSYAFGFQVGDYDRTQLLVLDPAVLIYCGYIGGSGYDYGFGMAVDGSGNAYVTGYTQSTETTFPVAVGPDLTFNGAWDYSCNREDAFVAKVKADGTGLVYCGYIGGSSKDNASGIAVDGSGNAYVAGITYSSEATFPVAIGPDLTFNGPPDYQDAFVAKVNSLGTSLVYCGYIGSSDSTDEASAIALDTLGCAYVTGYTGATEAMFPVKAGPDLTSNGGWDAFVAKVKADGTALVYCGYIGGSLTDYGVGIAVNTSGNAYVTGYTQSTETTFPVTVGPDLTFNGFYDVFVAKVNASGTALVYCGYIGGIDYDGGYGIAVDGLGNAYVTGSTFSTETTFPVTVGPDLTFNGFYDAFVAKVNASGTALVYCGYIGGSGMDNGFGIAVDGAGNAYVTGETSSTEATFPVTVGPDLTFNGGYFGDAFVAKVNATGTAFVYCGYIGGIDNDSGRGIAVDGLGNAYVTGGTPSTEATFPVKVGPDLTSNGIYDTFVAKISSIQKDDFLGTWDGQGVYYRNSDTGAWVKMASPATLITAGDLGGDGVDDLIGIWPTQGGVWLKSSTNGAWTKLSSTARHIGAGDMNGDGRVDLLGTWDGQGVYYRNSVSGAWVKMATPADLVSAGDLDGDGTDDLIGIWLGQGGVWVKYSKTGGWAKLSSTAKDIAAGDTNGDGRDDLLATYDGQGVYYRNSMNGAWVKMANPADQVTCGDLDGDGTKDLIGIWPAQGGVWVKYSKTGGWEKLSSTARDIAAGIMRAGGATSLLRFMELPVPIGGYVEGPESLVSYQDLSSEGPGGLNFLFQEEKNIVPQDQAYVLRTPGPGEPGFRWIEQKNLYPQENKRTNNKKNNYGFFY